MFTSRRELQFSAACAILRATEQIIFFDALPILLLGCKPHSIDE